MVGAFWRIKRQAGGLSRSGKEHFVGLSDETSTYVGQVRTLPTVGHNHTSHCHWYRAWLRRVRENEGWSYGLSSDVLVVHRHCFWRTLSHRQRTLLPTKPPSEDVHTNKKPATQDRPANTQYSPAPNKCLKIQHCCCRKRKKVLRLTPPAQHSPVTSKRANKLTMQHYFAL